MPVPVAVLDPWPGPAPEGLGLGLACLALRQGDRNITTSATGLKFNMAVHVWPKLMVAHLIILCIISVTPDEGY